MKLRVHDAVAPLLLLASFSVSALMVAAAVKACSEPAPVAATAR